MPRRSDEGMTTAVASLILFSLAFIIFASAFAWVGGTSELPEKTPRVMVLAGETGVQATPAGETKSWSVAAVTHGVWYSDITWRLGGKALPCTSTWGDEDGWRVHSNGAPVECDGEHPRDVLIRPGDILEVFAAGAGQAGTPSLRGRDLQAVDIPAHSLLVTLPVA